METGAGKLSLFPTVWNKSIQNEDTFIDKFLFQNPRHPILKFMSGGYTVICNREIIDNDI